MLLLISYEDVWGSTVNYQAKVLIHLHFLKVVDHEIVIDQRNQTAHLYEIQITVIYSRANLVTDVNAPCK